MPTRTQSIEDEIEIADRVILASEDWAKSYAQQPETHAKLIKSQAKLIRIMRKYFRTLSKERINNYINWQQYSSETVKAYQFNVIVDVEEIDEEDDYLMSVINDPLQLTMALGAGSAEQTYKIDLGLTPFHEAIMKANANYVGDLVKGITNTTKDRIKQSIDASMRLNESVEDATARLQDTVNDSRRAEMIARTESVNAYNKGISIFGKESDATGKIWEVSSDPCPECEGNDVGEIPFDESFPSGDDEPTAHPNCECGMSLVHDYGNGDDTSDDDSEE